MSELRRYISWEFEGDSMQVNREVYLCSDVDSLLNRECEWEIISLNKPAFYIGKTTAVKTSCGEQLSTEFLNLGYVGCPYCQGKIKEVK